MVKSVRWAMAAYPVAMWIAASDCACADFRPPVSASGSGSPFRRQQAPLPGGTREWSGEAGASGHPQMTVEAIRAAAADFPNCVARMWPDAAKRGVTQQNFVASHARSHARPADHGSPGLAAGVHQGVLGISRHPRQRQRIARGKEMLAQYRTTFDAVEKAYGVDRYTIAAIWGVETNYGQIGGDRPVLRSTATLACVGRRQAYFKEEFLSDAGNPQPGRRASRIASRARGLARSGRPSSCRHRSSASPSISMAMAGATWWISIPDIIASTANNLKLAGWVPGQTWGYEVALPQGFDYLLASRANQKTMKEWEALGVRRANGKPFPRPGDKAYLVVPAGARGPGFLMLQNFRAIMKYNPAEAYALAIGHLSRPVPRRSAVRAGVAARRARSVAERAAGTAAASGAQGLRYRRAGRPAWTEIPGCPDEISGFGRVCRRTALRRRSVLDRLRSR